VSNQKFESIWVDKENLPKLVLRILPVGTAKLCHVKNRVADNDLFDKVEA